MNKKDREVALAMEPSNSFEGGKVFVEVDITNCFMVLPLKELSEEVDAAESFSTLLAAKEHYKAWRSALSKYSCVSVPESKKELIKVVHLGKPTVDLPFMWNLALEMRAAVDLLLAKDKFKYLEGLFSNRRCPAASKLHYALSATEDAILAALESDLTKIPGVTMNTYVFDGGAFLVPDGKVHQFRSVAENVARKFGVDVTVRVF